jgi:hypothetical protein
MKDDKIKSCRVFIHQPDFAPWITFFKRIAFSDKFVILDDVQFNRRGFINRDYLLLNKKKSLITIPTIKTNRDDTLIKDVKIYYDDKWIEKFLKTISINYNGAANFNETFLFLKNLINKKYTNLIELNLEIIKFVIEKIDIKIEILHSSDLNISSTKSQKILDICKKINATEYITGKGSIDYLKLEDFDKENIKINQNILFTNKYIQQNKSFVSDLSILDIMFNHNFEEIKKIIQ